MSNLAAIRRLREKTGYEPFRVTTIRCRTKLPAALWRSLSVAERPYACQDIMIVAVDDDDETAVAMPARHYDALVDRVRQLEDWVAEFFEEADRGQAS